MEFSGLSVADLTYLSPELALVISAIVISLIDLFMPGRVSRTVIGWLTLVALLVSAFFVIQHLGIEEPIELLGASYRVDDFANIIKLILLGSTALIVLMGIGSVDEKDIQHKGEFFYFFLPATIGGMILASSADLITIFVGLELLGITTYILVGMRKKDQRSNEASFKYIVQGAISSAIILYGMSFFYGMSGSTNLAEIGYVLNGSTDDFGAMIYVAGFLLIAGFGFKIAAAPFHAWAPDVYQGAPTPVTAYLGVVSKAAAFVVLFRISHNLFRMIGGTAEFPITNDLFLGMSVMAAAAMVIGNTMALRQKNMKRLLALSGIANAGYLLVPIVVVFGTNGENFGEFTFYLIAYALMNIGAIAVLLVVEKSSGNTEMKSFAGLYHRAPWTAFAMTVLILSLAGIPLTGGFFGKIFIILGSMQGQVYWLGAVMIATSVMSFYYYFSIIRQMYMRSDVDDKITVSKPIGIVIWVTAVLTVAMGAYPNGVMKFINEFYSIFDLLL